MNFIPGPGKAWHSAPGNARMLSVSMALLTIYLILSACESPASDLDGGLTASELSYQVEYLISPRPTLGGALIEMKIRQPRSLLREVDMQLGEIDADSIGADGDLESDGIRLRWSPPEDGGALRWFVPIASIRSEGAYDAYIDHSFSLFRFEDLIPPTRTRTVKGAASNTQVKFVLPDGWSSTTQYFGRDQEYSINKPESRFDRPSGWVVMGDLGVRNEDIADTRVIVAAPVGHGARRLDVLALLQWTLPELKRILPEFPDRLTVVSAAGPMWRGGLSAPASLYIHADLPLISENATSTLLHEVMHIGLDLRAEEGDDWIIEGLAEYYGLELLRRSNSISTSRYLAAIENLRDWGSNVDHLCSKQSTGPVTARATTIFYALDAELRSNSGKDVDYRLDDLLPILRAEGTKVTIGSLRNAAIQLAGFLPTAIESKNLPGCTE